jgi:hypothetical protein
MRFSSRSEKENFGKRRKLKDCDARSSAPRVQHQQNGPCFSGTLPVKAISIRIGTEALTDVASNLHSKALRTAASSSDASSDTMLFDCEDLPAAPNPNPGLTPIRDQDHQTLVGVHTQSRAAPPGKRGGQAADLNGGISYRTRTHDAAQSDERPRHELVYGFSADSVATCDEDKVSGCFITQQIGDIDRPLRLVVDRSPNFSALDEEDIAAQGCVIGETNHDPRLANASPFECGNQQEHSDADAAAGQPRTIDDGPWKRFLAIAENSSNHSLTAYASESDRMHYRPTMGVPTMANAESMPWSQHAIQGGQTCTNSSFCISASLPLVTRGSERDALRMQPQDEGKPDENPQRKQRDEDEQLWHTFVFGNEIPATSGSADEEAVVDAAENTPSRRVIPSSLRVRSLSSPPCQSVSLGLA